MPAEIPRWKPPKARARSKREKAFYSSPEWRSVREVVLIRDAFRCTEPDCRRAVSGAEAHVDHVIPREDGGTDEPGNLKTKCRSCHSRKTVGEQRRRGQI